LTRPLSPLSTPQLLSINPVSPKAKPADTPSNDRRLNNYSRAFTGWAQRLQWRSGRADHPLQADFFQRLCEIFNEFINSNDGDESDSTYRTKMQQLIDDVLSYEPPLRVYNSTGTAMLTLKMRDEGSSQRMVWMTFGARIGKDNP
jgi:hypothetical protein